jgi:hypothetical protein
MFVSLLRDPTLYILRSMDSSFFPGFLFENMYRP